MAKESSEAALTPHPGTPARHQRSTGSRQPAGLLLVMLALLYSPALAQERHQAPARDDEPAAKMAATRAALLGQVRRFGYQLQRLSVAEAAASAADLLVVEPLTETGRLSPADVARLKKKPDGRPRLLLAYLSIGEAEDYHAYWQKEWRARPPAWLGPENPQWRGNYEVRYWDPAWQALILGSPAALLDQIVADGYDGAYLDIVDGFEFWEARGVRDARSKMVEWVTRIASHARQRRPAFMIVPQNGEALALEPGYLAQVDALGREDLFFEGDRPQPRQDTREAQAHIALFQQAHKAVFLIEYCRREANRIEVQQRAAASGYLPLITVRPLDRLLVSEPANTSAAAPAR